MANQKQAGLKPPAKVQAATWTKTEDEKLIKQFDQLIALYVLKENARKENAREENAMFAREVAQVMNDLFPHPDPDNALFSERTVYRLFKSFASLEKSKDDTDSLLPGIFQMFPYLCGGEVRSCPAGSHNGEKNGKQKKYYFDPILSEGDMEMICGTVRSSRYLSNEEKDFLLARLQILQPAYGSDSSTFLRQKSRPIDGISRSLPQRPRESLSDSLPVESSKFLSHIQLIHQAIRQGWQIQVTYGTYETDDSGKAVFRAANLDHPYYLNPYAMMWNGGRYYLIATHKGHNNPAHFRLDRIMEVRFHEEICENGTIPAKRDAVPEPLKPYFTGSGGTGEFDATRYTNTYPEMRIYGAEKLVTCCFAYTSTSLQILIDYFGTKNLRRGNDPKDCIRVRNIQYENALGFCVMMADHLTLLSPLELVEDVRSKLSSIVKKYES